MTCEGCVKDVSDSLYKIAGISKVEANLKEQLVRVEGTGMDLDRLWCFVLLLAIRCVAMTHPGGLTREKTRVIGVNAFLDRLLIYGMMLQHHHQLSSRRSRPLVGMRS